MNGEPLPPVLPYRAYEAAGLPLPPPLPAGSDWSLFNKPSLDGTQSPISDDAFSVIDGVDDDERAKIVQDFYEGPMTCQCCINWIDGIPDGHKDEESEDSDDNGDEGCPIVVRRKRTGGGSKPFEMHSIEIRSVALRSILIDVFNGFDGLLPGLKYLTFIAPFRQFYYRWERFEQAIKVQTDESLFKSLKVLRRLVKSELGSAFSVSKDLMDHEVITQQYLWTLFKPGDLVYSNEDGVERLYHLRTISHSAWSCYLYCQFVDWDGRRFGLSEVSIEIRSFIGTKKITDLVAFPIHFHSDPKGLRERLVLRGQKFRDLTGIHYKSYQEITNQSPKKARAREVGRRIIIDAGLHPEADKLNLIEIYDNMPMSLTSDLIKQEPLSSKEPPGGHIPLPLPGEQPRRPYHHPPPLPAGMSMGIPNPVGFTVVRGKKKIRGRYNLVPPPPPPPPPGIFVNEDEAVDDINSLVKERNKLSDFHMLLCNPEVRGFCLREKEWSEFKVDHIEEIEFNTEPFDSLVLPDGYKDLILAFVESQLKDGETFDDVINGKGGGIVILLSGAPGVGKTLTAESVAERIQAPLYKMELREARKPKKNRNPEPCTSSEDEATHDIEDDFKLAAKWDAVLLIDECDTYLQTRSDNDARRNRIVQTFLQKLEYYPSLLFLTTNRPGTLDPALASRIHLTINYPALDLKSRLIIWRNFLARVRPAPHITEEEVRTLASIELDGRRIKNVIKTAGIMAKREGRGMDVGDVKKVMKITEGLKVE